MTPLVLWALSAHAASVDLAHPEMLAKRSLEQLVDLTAIESATMTVWFEGPFASMVLGDSGAQALLEYVASKTPGAHKDDALTYAEATRLMGSARFEVKVVNHAREGVVVSVPVVHWGELDSFAARPDDQAIRADVVGALWGLDLWGHFHLSRDRFATDRSIVAVESPTGITATMKGDPSSAFELDRDTLLITAIKIPQGTVGLQYVKSGERYLLGHLEMAVNTIVQQFDLTFEEVNGAPWPHDMTWHQETSVYLKIHFVDVALKDDVAPFLKVKAKTPAVP
jgi:hypothetical protein